MSVLALLAASVALAYLLQLKPIYQILDSLTTSARRSTNVPASLIRSYNLDTLRYSPAGRKSSRPPELFSGFQSLAPPAQEAQSCSSFRHSDPPGGMHIPA